MSELARRCRESYFKPVSLSCPECVADNNNFCGCADRRRLREHPLPCHHCYKPMRVCFKAEEPWVAYFSCPGCDFGFSTSIVAALKKVLWSMPETDLKHTPRDQIVSYSDWNPPDKYPHFYHICPDCDRWFYSRVIFGYCWECLRRIERDLESSRRKSSWNSEHHIQWSERLGGLFDIGNEFLFGCFLLYLVTGRVRAN